MHPVAVTLPGRRSRPRRVDEGSIASIMTRMLPLITVAFIAGLGMSSAAHSQMMPGGDVDRYGCRASAGYSWCARTKKCERPWELAEAKGFKLSPIAIARRGAEPRATGQGAGLRR